MKQNILKNQKKIDHNMKKCVIGFVEESRARDVDDAGCITKKKNRKAKSYF